MLSTRKKVIIRGLQRYLRNTGSPSPTPPPPTNGPRRQIPRYYYPVYTNNATVSRIIIVVIIVRVYTHTFILYLKCFTRRVERSTGPSSSVPRSGRITKTRRKKCTVFIFRKTRSETSNISTFSRMFFFFGSISKRLTSCCRHELDMRN